MQKTSETHANSLKIKIYTYATIKKSMGAAFFWKIEERWRKHGRLRAQASLNESMRGAQKGASAA
jgi:hypothetical protein